MEYYVSTMIGVRSDGVFSGNADMEDFTQRATQVALRTKEENPEFGISTKDITHCMSKELVAMKGGYIVFAGVFNYWTYDISQLFAKNLSKEFVTEVMIMSWDEERDKVQCNVFLDGRPLFEIKENPISQVLRRVC